MFCHLGDTNVWVLESLTFCAQVISRAMVCMLATTPIIATPPSGKATPSATITAAAPHQKAAPCGAGCAARRNARSGHQLYCKIATQSL